MFGFLLSWIIGHWGPKISCTNICLTSGFLIPLLTVTPKLFERFIVYLGVDVVNNGTKFYGVKEMKFRDNFADIKNYIHCVLVSASSQVPLGTCDEAKTSTWYVEQVPPNRVSHARVSHAIVREVSSCFVLGVPLTPATSIIQVVVTNKRCTTMPMTSHHI